MKKITLILFMVIGHSVLSQNLSVPLETWKSKIVPVFQGLDKARIPNGILLDYAMDFTDVSVYNGNINSSQKVDLNVFSNIYKTIFTARTTTDTLSFPRMKTIAQNWAMERVTWNQQEQKTIVIGGLYYKYSSINSNALPQNKITVANNKYYDKYINGVWQNPYQTKETVAFTPVIRSYNKSYFNVILPQSLMLSNQLGSITKIEFDANDGKGYRQLTYGQPLSVLYYQNGTYTWKYRIRINNSYYLYSSSQIKIEADSFAHRDANNFENDIVIPGPQGLGFRNGATLRIDYAPNHNGELRQPFIVAEGFDPGSILEPETEGGELSLEDFRRSFTPEAGNNLFQLLDGANQQYDIVYIDWENGVGRLEDNSIVLENVLNWVNTNKVGTTQNVLLGQSMGGVIGRYTLARMEQESKIHDVSLFVSHDAPLQGSNTPLSTQFFSRHLYKEYVTTPILYGLGEGVLPVILGLAELISNAINNINGVNTSVLPYMNPEDVLTLQDTPAAVQLNYEWVTFNETVSTAIHQAWQQEFELKGFPQNCRNVAISNGNECAVDQGFEPGDTLIAVHDVDDPSFLGDLVHLITNPLIGAVTNDLGLHLLGQLPGSSKYFYDFDLKSTPNTNDPDRNVYFGKIRYEKKLLWIIPISHTLTERSKNATPTSLPFGSYSGGTFDITNATSELPSQFPPQILVNQFYGFIPVVSAIDVRRNGGITQGDYLRRYAGGTITEPGLSSGFDNFIVDYSQNPTNNRHISFQRRNGDWLANELTNEANNFFDCTFLCEVQEIAGPTNICTSGTYSVNSPANATVTWSINPFNAGTFQGQGTGQIQLSLNANFSGAVTVTSNITIPSCGVTTNLTKRIFAGKPSFNLQEITYLNYVDLRIIGAGGADINEQGITQVTWAPGAGTNGGNLQGQGQFFRNARGYGYNWTLPLTITVTNSCGSRTISVVITPPAPDPCDTQPKFNIEQEDIGVYSLSPDPDPCDEQRVSTDNKIATSEIGVYDFSGTPLFSTKGKVNLNSLPSGIYILKTIVDGEVITKKIIK